MTFKIQIAGLEGSEILHMRPIKPWSHWDTAVATAHFGAAVALTVFVGVDLISSAGAAGFPVPQDVISGLGAAIMGIATWEGIDAYRKSIKAIKLIDETLKNLPHIDDDRLEKLKRQLEKSLLELGDQRTIRFVDFDDMNMGVHAGVHSNEPMAMTMPLLSDKQILIGVNIPFVKSRDDEARFVIAAHEVSHNYAPVARMVVMWNSLSTSNKVVASIALGGSVALGNVPLALLAIASYCAVPILRQAYFRRLEFQSDRGAAFLTRNADAVHRVVGSTLEANADRQASPELEIRDRRMYRYPRLYRAANKIFQIADKMLSRVYATHPAVASRQRALRVLAKQQAHARHN